MNKVKEKAIKELGIDGQNHFLVRVRLALLQHQWKVLYLDNGIISVRLIVRYHLYYGCFIATSMEGIILDNGIISGRLIVRYHLYYGMMNI